MKISDHHCPRGNYVAAVNPIPDFLTNNSLRQGFLMSQLYMAYRFMSNKSCMKKSEKIKGKEAVAARKKKQVQYGIIAAAGIILVAVLGFVLFNPFVAKTGDTVHVFYTGTLDDGTVFDTNVNATPLAFTIGKGMVLPGFEEAVIGMGVNDVKTVRIPSEKAYGMYNNSLIHIINRSAFPVNVTPVAGQYYAIKSITDGTVSYVKIINITPSKITLDENHELAGQNLSFSIRLAGIN
jgi:peptidylprolyl isomerase